MVATEELDESRIKIATQWFEPFAMHAPSLACELQMLPIAVLVFF